jgi:hypothetical protein
MASELWDVFVTITRNGIGSLHVRIGGFGNLASTETRIGSGVAPGRATDDCLRNSPPFFRTEGGGGWANAC